MDETDRQPNNRTIGRLYADEKICIGGTPKRNIDDNVSARPDGETSPNCLWSFTNR